MALYLKEHLTFDAARMEVLTESHADGKGKSLYMKGVFIQGGVKNHNERVYPVTEIETAVSTLNEQIKGGYSVLGEGGQKVFEMAREASADQRVQKYLKQAVTSLIKDLKIK